MKIMGNFDARALSTFFLFSKAWFSDHSGQSVRKFGRFLKVWRPSEVVVRQEDRKSTCLHHVGWPAPWQESNGRWTTAVPRSLSGRQLATVPPNPNGRCLWDLQHYFEVKHRSNPLLKSRLDLFFDSAWDLGSISMSTRSFYRNESNDAVFYWFLMNFDRIMWHLHENQCKHAFFQIQILPRSRHTCTSKDHSRSHTDRNFIKMWIFTNIYAYLQIFMSVYEHFILIHHRNKHTGTLVSTHNHRSFMIRCRSIFAWKSWNLMKFRSKFEVCTVCLD